jgi:hypothetical protein
LKKEHGYYVGWKTYRGYKSKEKLLIPIWQGKCQVIGTWMNEKDYRFTMDKSVEMIETTFDRNQDYQKGFHIYLEPKRNVDKKTAIFFNRKVYFDGIVAYGLQDCVPVVVARKMKILRQRKVDCRSKKSE